MADVIAVLVLSGYAGGAIITARWSLWDDARSNGGELPDGAVFGAGVCAVLWPGILVLGGAWCLGKYVLRPVLRFLIVPRLVKKTRAAKEFAAREERIEVLSDEVRAGMLGMEWQPTPEPAPEPGWPHLAQLPDGAIVSRVAVDSTRHCGNQSAHARHYWTGSAWAMSGEYVTYACPGGRL